MFNIFIFFSIFLNYQGLSFSICLFQNIIMYVISEFSVKMTCVVVVILLLLLLFLLLLLIIIISGPHRITGNIKIMANMIFSIKSFHIVGFFRLFTKYCISRIFIHCISSIHLLCNLSSIICLPFIQHSKLCEHHHILFLNFMIV